MTNRARDAGRLQSILDASDDAIVTTDLDGRVIDWNDRATEILGWEAEDVRGQAIGSFLVPEQARGAFLEALEQFRSAGKSSLLEKRRESTALTEDGREIPVEISTSIIVLEDAIVCALFMRDLSERREEDLRRAQRMLETRLLQHAVAHTGTSGEFRKVLRTCLEVVCDVAGWAAGIAVVVEAGSVVGETACHPGNVGPALETWAERLHGGRLDGLLERVRLRARPAMTESIANDPLLGGFDGWDEAGVDAAQGFPVVVDERVEIVLVFLLGEQGVDRQGAILTRNIASQLARVVERRRWEEQRARLAAIVDGSYDAIIGKTLDGRILSWNDGAQRTYGYTAAEAVGNKIAGLILPEGLDAEEEPIRNATRSGRRLAQFETWRRHRDGHAVLVSITVSPIKDSRGRVIGSSSIERDVTQRRSREIELREAVAAAETANRTKSEFLANISHELRTPMNAILGMLELALGESLAGEVRDYLETAHDSANTLLHLLNDLLDFSRIEAGRFELDHEPFRLRDTLDAVVKSLSLRAYEKGLELACHVEADVPDHLRGDGRRLRQVLMNLVGNAIKFTEQGEVVVHARLERRDSDRARIGFDVSDTGVGIAPEHRERIFEAFTQADASSTRKYQGTGLGLAISRELVERMGGSIVLQSEPGRGSVFTAATPFDVIGDRAPSRRSEESVVAELRDLPVLVVDDNATNRRILAEMLRNWRMLPVLAESGEEALEILRRARAEHRTFPLVVVDALMPTIDGFELVARIREEGLTERATVLMLSSADRQAFRDVLETLDVDAFLEKPVSQSAMLDTIMTTLHGPQLEGAAVRTLVPAARSLRVLVAEDTPANQKVVRSILAKRGHDSEVAHNGREALEKHLDEEFDAILMDVQMPTMDGLQATRAIRALDDPAKSSIPVIAMTAHAMQGDRERCLAAGMDDYVSKPIDARRLVRLVEELVDPSLVTYAPEEEFSAPQRSTAPTPAAAAGAVFEPSVALGRLGGDEELLCSLIQYYREDSARLLETIRERLAVDRLDDDGVDEFVRAAHSLKGLSANLEAVPAREAAAEMERLAKARRIDDARDRLAPLEETVETLWRVLEDYCD